MSPAIPRVPLAPGYTISRLLKGGWQVAGGHGVIDPSTALDDMDRFAAAASRPSTAPISTPASKR